MISTREFHPELNSRRSEVILWGLVVVVLATVVFLYIQDYGVPLVGSIFALFMLFVAGSTSLSNGMDRNTVLTLKPDSVDFRNGLRNISLGWDEIREVRVTNSRYGKQVNILGDEIAASTSLTSSQRSFGSAGFNFRTLSVIERKGEIRSQMGFAAGEFIIEQILKSSGLQEMEQTDQNNCGRYYARP